MHLLWLIGVLGVLVVVAAPAAVIVLVVLLSRRRQRPKQGTLYSPDGRWWWDGRAWQPAPSSTGAQTPGPSS